MFFISGVYPPMLKTVGSSGVTPTATVQPTLLSLNTNVKPVVGTASVSPVRQMGPGQYQQYPGHMYPGFPLQSAASQSTSPGYYPGQGSQGQSPYVQYPNFPYNPSFAGQSGGYQQFQSAKTSSGHDQYSGNSSSYPQPTPGYFIASANPSPFPGAIVPVTSVSTGASSQSSSGAGFICAGPYNYPYGQGRVIGPIIAIGKRSFY